MQGSPLKGRTALVTGAAKRLGRAIAEALADAGCDIVVHYRTAGPEAAALCRELEGRGVRAWALAADFANEEECRTLVRRAIEAAGHLDILVNSASIFEPATLEDVTFEDLEQHLRVNAWAPLLLCREFRRLSGRGSIVNLLDARLEGTDPAHIGYIVSKQALAEITKTMAIEYAPDIRVNAVAPGLILPPPGKDASSLEKLARDVPLRRHGEARDVALAVRYLVESDFLTGEIIHVDGGRHLLGARPAAR